ncbi:hypothetical protein BIU88_02400 [Chlorobaculum limnaeum]|uniref:RNA methyltransferase n=1 Tax=Chlorobaculum limnaeum TaxID=274537 RepID=A0A1D8D3M3_CHLLM|nr:hypothetical protein BIU88_02400 [Chlorobaculum limnaeum]
MTNPIKPTYSDIQKWIRENHGFVPKSCWIAHVKELHGLNPRIAGNRILKDARAVPCPENKRGAIEDAFRHFGMIN